MREIFTTMFRPPGADFPPPLFWLFICLTLINVIVHDFLVRRARRHPQEKTDNRIAKIEKRRNVAAYILVFAAIAIGLISIKRGA